MTPILRAFRLPRRAAQSGKGRVAAHEVGHVIAGLALGYTVTAWVKRVRTRARDGWAGMAESWHGEHEKVPSGEETIIYTAAGPMAEYFTMGYLRPDAPPEHYVRLLETALEKGPLSPEDAEGLRDRDLLPAVTRAREILIRHLGFHDWLTAQLWERDEIRAEPILLSEKWPAPGPRYPLPAAIAKYGSRDHRTAVT